MLHSDYHERADPMKHVLMEEKEQQSDIVISMSFAGPTESPPEGLQVCWNCGFEIMIDELFRSATSVTVQWMGLQLATTKQPTRESLSRARLRRPEAALLGKVSGCNIHSLSPFAWILWRQHLSHSHDCSGSNISFEWQGRGMSYKHNCSVDGGGQNSCNERLHCSCRWEPLQVRHAHCWKSGWLWDFLQIFFVIAEVFTFCNISSRSKTICSFIFQVFTFCNCHGSGCNKDWDTAGETSSLEVTSSHFETLINLNWTSTWGNTSHFELNNN